MRPGTRPAPAPGIIEGRRVPDLPIDYAHPNLQRWRGTGPVDLWAVPPHAYESDLHWLHVCMKKGWQQAMNAVKLAASVPQFYGSTLVRSYWGIVGGNVLPGTDTPAIRPSTPDGMLRASWEMQFWALAPQIKARIEHYPCRIGGLLLSSKSRMDELLKLRLLAMREMPNPLAEDSIEYLHSLVPAPIEYPGR